jgi:hypothetical protein
MSKSSRTKRKQKRFKERSARKDANRRIYESYRDSGNNSKRKNKSNVHSGPGMTKISHPNGPCGNLGCNLCTSLKKNAKGEVTFIGAGPNYLKKVFILATHDDGTYTVRMTHNGSSPFKAYRSWLR